MTQELSRDAKIVLKTYIVARILMMTVAAMLLIYGGYLLLAGMGVNLEALELAVGSYRIGDPANDIMIGGIFVLVAVVDIAVAAVIFSEKRALAAIAKQQR